MSFFHFLKKNKVDSSEKEEVIKINTFQDLKPEAFKQYKTVQEDTLSIQKKRDSYILRKYVKIFVLILGGLVTLAFFIASFSSYMGWIQNKDLAPYFLQGVLSFISAIIGFGIGVFYEQSKD